MKNFYPVHLDIQGKPCLVVGGGPVAERKVKSLLECEGNVTVVSPNLTMHLHQLKEKEAFRWIARKFCLTDLYGTFLVIAATNHSALNQWIAKECTAGGILVNVAHGSNSGNFIVPSVMRQNSLTISVSTNGESPLLASMIRRQLQSEFGPEFDRLVKFMSHIRPFLSATMNGPSKREKLWSGLMEVDLRELWRHGQEETVKEKIWYCLLK